LAATLRRLAECDPQPDELIVVEQSAEVDPQVKEALKLFGTRGILVRQGRPNAQVARNEAARKSRSEILLFLDDDVDPEKNLIGAHLENYRDPSIHAVAGFYYEPGEKESDSLRSVQWWRPLTKIEKIPAFYIKRVDSPLWPSCNGSIWKNVFFKMGGFDERFKYTLFDDTDLSIRLLRAGYRCVHDPAAKVAHLKEPTGGNRPVRPNDEVIAPRACWSNWVYFFIINWGVFGVGELFYRLRTHVFRRPYLMRPSFFFKAFSEFLAGAILGAKMLRKGRKLAKFD
jgi:glycosyltransferase involved in cell wall biosynthesis